jgi:Fe-S oxidoreductase
MGISNRSLFRAARAAYAESGLAELNPTLRSVIENSRNFRHSWGMNPVEVVARAGLFLTFEDTEIPLDVSGAEYYFACPAAGNTKIPDLGIQLLQILNAAGVSYTVSTEIIDTGTEAHHVAVHEPLALELLLEWERNAERLNAKKVLVLECGCDVRTMYVEATQLLGRPFKLPFVSIDSLFLEIVETGALPTEKLDLTLTLHDPCYVNRLAGLGSHARALLRRLATRFVEMQPNGPMNYCCNAGAGGMRIPENTGLRRKVSRLKAKQIEATNADGVVAPCVICYLGLQDTVEHYKLGAHGRYRVRLLFEIIYESMMRALVRSNSVDRIKTPKVFTLMRPAEVRKYSLSGYMRRLRQSPIFPGLMRRYRDDPLVRRYAESHSGFWRFFDELSQLGSFSDRVIP